MNMLAIKNLALTLIPEFRLRKKLLDMSRGELVHDETGDVIVGMNLNPLMSSNFILVDIERKVFLNDKMCILVNTLLRDNSLVVGNPNKPLTDKYKLSYNHNKGLLSLVYHNGLSLTVTVNKRIQKAITDNCISYLDTNNLLKSDIELITSYAIIYYVSSGILNIPKYEYPISIITDKTNISVINFGGKSVIYTHSGECTIPKVMKVKSKELNDCIDVLRVLGNNIVSKNFNYDLATRILSVINYCQYFNVEVDLEFIKEILDLHYNGFNPTDDSILAMIDYIPMMKQLIRLEDKLVKTPKQKRVVI